jgi:hypothetical protein
MVKGERGGRPRWVRAAAWSIGIGGLARYDDRYNAEGIGRPPRDFRLSDVERVLLGTVRRICGWRLGRERAPDGWPSAKEVAPEPKTVDEILLCLKRLLKSAKRWNKEGGRQGYLDFVSQYVR